MAAHQLAQVNVARLREPIDSPLLADFVAALEPVNALADAAPGFVWRLQTEEGDATSIRAFDDDMLIVNMSVWASVQALADFAYGVPDHRSVLRRRREWFERLDTPVVALWWVPAGHRPTVAEARDRLELLERVGPSPAAFTFRTPFDPPADGDAPVTPGGAVSSEG